MAKHFFGKMIDGVLGRFRPEFSDEEFEAAIAHNGGYLPQGWKAWHLEDNEVVTNSKRVQALSKRPEIRDSHWTGASIPMSHQRVIEELVRDARRQEGA